MSHRAMPPSRRGQAWVAALFWVLGAGLLFGPFLRSPAAPDPEGDDPGRKVSEIDIPFDEDVAEYEKEFGAGLASALREASEKQFGEDSPTLAASGLVELRRIEPGRRAYERLCIGCHGSTGDGAGPAARYLKPRPRNFRRGTFKFTSTPTGTPPLRRDLFQTVTRGLSGSSMPTFRLLSEETRWNLVEFVRYLAIRGSFEQLAIDLAWEDEEVPDLDETGDIVRRRWSPETVKAVYPAASEPADTAASVAHGRELFLAVDGANCAACHGAQGRGDGPSASEFEDDWGYPIRPRDLTRGVFRAGSEAADLYRSIETGINGTPMPSYGGSMKPEDIWDLVHFIQSLREEG